MARGAREAELRRQPIAIVGIGCRFPGAETKQQFWDLLCQGRSAIVEVPAERWSADAFYDTDMMAPGKTNCRWGGFLRGVDGFDCGAFSLSPREARHMDPQHRLMLEVSWEALEDAGIPFGAVAGSPTGVFVGAMWNDYLRLQARDLNRVDPYSLVGACLAFTANRVSHFFDLRGPSFAIEVGCASSLMAVHLACNSLWSGESQLALAGGVNLLLAPDNYVVHGKGGVLSPDGLCKTFDADADGFVPGEGAGVVVLKPLSRAQADGDRVYAVIRGTAANHNGKTDWIMAVEQAAQEQLLRAALDSAGVAPEEVDYVELHGTGTKLGDPVEARAIGAVVGQARPQNSPCAVGSVKTNIGHPESAGGVAHLIKVALAMHQGQIPPSLNMRRLNPAIPQQELNIQLQTELGPWPRQEPVAGINSLSLGGGNAHVVLAGAPQSHSRAAARAAGPPLLPLSACTAAALTAQARSHLELLGAQTLDAEQLRDLCYSAARRRTHHRYRLALVGQNAAELRQGLQQFLDAEQSPRAGQAGAGQPLVLVAADAATAAGAAPAAVASRGAPELMQLEPFRAAVQRLDPVVRAAAGWSVAERLTQGGEAPAEQRPLVQLALQLGLAAQLEAMGLQPGLVAGLGRGRVAAAVLAGQVSAEQAVQLLLAPEAPQLREVQLSPADGTPALVLAGGAAETLAALLPAEPVADEAEALERALEQAGGGARLTLDSQLVAAGTTLSLDQGPPAQVLARAVAALYEAGVAVRWERYYPAGRYQALPGYPWQRRPMWIKTSALDWVQPAAADERPSVAQGLHLGQPTELAFPEGSRLWQLELGQASASYLGDHRVYDRVVFPAVGFVTLALEALEQTFGEREMELQQVNVERALFLPQSGTCRLQLLLQRTGDAEAQLRIASWQDDEDGGPGRWAVHVSAEARPAQPAGQ